MKKRLVALLLAIVMVMTPIVGLGAPVEEERSRLILNAEPLEIDFAVSEVMEGDVVTLESEKFLISESSQILILNIDYNKLRSDEFTDMSLSVSTYHDNINPHFGANVKKIDIEPDGEHKNGKLKLYIDTDKLDAGGVPSIELRLSTGDKIIDVERIIFDVLYTDKPNIYDLDSIDGKVFDFEDYRDEYNNIKRSYRLYISTDKKIKNVDAFINDSKIWLDNPKDKVVNFDPYWFGNFGENEIRIEVELEDNIIIKEKYNFTLNYSEDIKFKILNQSNSFVIDDNGYYNVLTGDLDFRINDVVSVGRYPVIKSVEKWSDEENIPTFYHEGSTLYVTKPGYGRVKLEWKGREHLLNIKANYQLDGYYRIINDVSSNSNGIILKDVYDDNSNRLYTDSNTIDVSKSTVFPIHVIFEEPQGYSHYIIKEGINKISLGKKVDAVILSSDSSSMKFDLNLHNEKYYFDINNEKNYFPKGTFEISGEIIKNGEVIPLHVKEKDIIEDITLTEFLKDFTYFEFNSPNGWDEDETTIYPEDYGTDYSRDKRLFIFGNKGFVENGNYFFEINYVEESEDDSYHEYSITLETPIVSLDGDNKRIEISNVFNAKDLKHHNNGFVDGTIKDEYGNKLKQISDPRFLVKAEKEGKEPIYIKAHIFSNYYPGKDDTNIGFYDDGLRGKYNITFMYGNHLLYEKYKEALNIKLEEAYDILKKTDEYTEKSLSNLQEILDIVENLKEDESVDYHQFKESINYLQESINNLVYVDTDESEEPGEGMEPGDNDTEQPGDNETEQPGENDTEQPGGNETEQPGDNDTEQPGDNDTEQPGGNDTEQPDGNETEQPGENDAEQPGGNETEQPGGNDTEQPGGNDTEQPGDNEIEQPGGNDSEQPDGNDTEQPGGNDSQQPSDETDKPDDETPEDDKDDEETEDDAKPEKRTVNIVEGINRIETATEISKTYFQTANHVIIADGFKFPDPLTASSLANELNGPVLLTSTDQVHESVINEIVRLGATKVTIIGGELSVSKSVEEKLSGLSGVTVDRIAGEDRFETSALVAERLGGLVDTDTVLIADGTNYPDALTASPLAAKSSSPILLVRPGDMPEDTVRILDEVNPQKTIIVGGVNSVSESVKAELPGDVTRVAGDNRYETSVEIAKHLPSTSAFGASGEGFADALAIGPVAAMKSMPILLIQKDDIPNPIKEELKEIEEFVVIGGDNTISKQVKEDLKK